MFFRLSAPFLLLLALAGCAEPPYNNIDNAQLKTMLEQGVPIYDVRRADEWRQTGVVEGSKLLTFIGAEAALEPNFFPRFTAAASRDTPVIVICRTGSRTSRLAEYLVEQLGYTHVYNVRNGITHWIREGNAVTQAQL